MRWFLHMIGCSVKGLGRGVSKAWKPAIVGVIFLYGLTNLSYYIERQFIYKPLISVPYSDFQKHNSLKNPCNYYEIAVRLIDDGDDLIISLYQFQQQTAIQPQPAIKRLPQQGSLPNMTSMNVSEQKVTKAQYLLALNNIQPAIRALTKGVRCESAAYEPSDAWEYRGYPVWVGNPLCRDRRLNALWKCAIKHAEWKIANAKLSEGIEELLVMAELGTDLQRNRSLLDNGSGRRAEESTYRSITNVIRTHRLPKHVYARIAHQLERIGLERSPIANTVRGDYLIYRENLRAVFSANYHDMDGWLCCCTDMDKFDENSTPMLLYIHKSLPGMQAIAFYNANRIWKKLADSYKSPYSATSKLNIDSMIPWYDCGNNILKESIKGVIYCRRMHTENVALNRGIMLMAALEAYRLEHGQYPKSLGALVSGKYIAKMPTDPFTDGKPFIYRRSGKKYIVYSVGPNMQDDGGEFTLLRRLDDKKGDIVFAPGVDLWASIEPDRAAQH